ncbi:PREDICTED: uncharacterized protein LOC106296660 isoform X2 [Brassica oleracea var. oleracea]|uniref:uncharacterized protein LOC106296660 isoform X2 n=1 Tax=Brassica oleracea var. oleracea TaxID=109376 RepID=UPI0006A704BF|nr:PREDICTED: uncharacterized protein LOC106296660 isoform X2 [Brassica oleracea var. oleracea]
MIQSTGSRGEDQMTQVARGVCHSPIGGSVVLASSLFHPESKSVVASGSNGSEKGPIGHSLAEDDNQGSCHTNTSFPSPIAHPRCALIRSLPMRIPRHPWEQLAGGETSRKFCS